MKQVLLSVIALIFFTSFQAQNIGWLRNFGGEGDDGPLSMTADASGNVYTTGYFQDTVDFDPGPGSFTLASKGDYDGYVSKLDAAGNFVWAISFGDTLEDYGERIVIDAGGYVLLTGAFTGTVDFDPGPGTYTMNGAQRDAFVVKLNASGNLVWAREFGAAGEDRGFGLACDGSGNLYCSGFFNLTVDFDPGPASFNLTATGWDIFVCKLDNSGNLVWADKMGGSGADISLGLALDASGNVYTAGTFRNIADFDPGAGVFNLTCGSVGPGGSAGNGYVSKLDANGNFVWAIGYTGTGYNEILNIVAAPGGNLVISGFYKGSADFDPGAGSSVSTAQGFDGFVAKINASGVPLWTKFISGPGDQQAVRCWVNAAGSVYVTGDFGGTTDFDPSPGILNLTAVGQQDLYLQELDALGNFVSVYSAGNSGYDTGNGITGDGSGNLYLTGTYSATTAFSSTISLVSNGMDDIFVMKFNDCSALISTQPVNASVWPGNAIQFGIVSTGPSFQWQQDIGFGFTNLSNGGQFSGANTATLTVSGAGPLQANNIFRCLVSSSTCSLMSLTAKLTLLDDTGIGELSEQELFTLSPNPSDGLIRVQASASQNNRLYRIFDQTGKLLLTGRMEGTQTSIDISSLAQGLYFMQIGSGQKPLKVVKQ